METLRNFIRTLGPLRLAILGGVLLALLGFFAWIITHVSTQPQALLYGDLDVAEAGKVVTELETSGVPYQLGSGGTAIFVPADQVARMRVALAEHGLPSGGSVGYEIFDTGNAFGTTNFQQNVNLVRALEGELARTIRAIDTVKTARVHLVLPQREVFSREKPRSSASVLLQMRGRSRLAPSQVVAVQNLIASAVPDLGPGQISIIDGEGTLLSEALEGNDIVSAAAVKADQRRGELENHLSRNLEQLVERTVGPGKVHAEVALEMDFDRIDSSEEIFNPDGQVVRSTQTVEQNSKDVASDGSPPVSVSTNLPDANIESGSTAGKSSAENRSEETVNYEISKKVVNHVREAGIVKRLSIAILVDGSYVTAADGTRTYHPRPAEELEQLSSLVRSASGLNAERGDKLEVVSMRFAEPEVVAEIDHGLLLGLDKDDLLRIGEYVALLILAMLVLVLVIRPIVARAIEAMPVAAAGASAALLAGRPATQELTGPDSDEAAAAQRALTDDRPDEMIDISRVEGRVKASSIKRVGGIVERHPEETLAILRSWLHAEK